MNEPIMAQIPTEGQTPVFPLETPAEETAADSPPVEEEKETTDEETPSSEEDNEQTEEENPTGDEVTDDNFAKHPRWKQREEDHKQRYNDQEIRHAKAIQDLREELKPSETPAPQDATPTAVPSWFGGDEQQWAEFQGWNQTLIDGVKTSIQTESQQKTEAEQTQIKEATDYMNSEIGTIESDKTLNPDGQKVDRNKLLKFTMDNELVDTQGRWNYKAAFQLMQAGVKNTKKVITDEKKQVAAQTTSQGGGETTPPSHATSETFQDPAKRPW